MTNPIIRRNTNIGAADAEADSLFLDDCFVDIGDLQTLLDCSDPRCLALGRTGSGKTALLQQVGRTVENSVELAPEALALNYITNSNVLKFFEEAGVGLDVFYQLLWRHILVVELLKLRFDITNESRQAEFLDYLKPAFLRDRAKKRAFDYLRDWGDKFWQQTEYRTREFTERLETDLKASVGVDSTYINAGIEGARKLTSEQRGEVRQRGTQIVSSVQIKELHDVIDFMAEEIFTERRRQYYVRIDRLDENWVDDRIRFKLIKALLEAVRSFKKIHAVKIIVALRTDLHYRVIKETVQAGFQEEKYRSLYLPIRWSRDQLIKMLDDRVHFIFRRQYTGENVGIRDILPSNQIDQGSAVDYVLDRTFFRPREAIIFVNECLLRAEGRTRVSLDILRQAEVPYSQARLVSLADEWRREFPRLADTARFLEHYEIAFTIDSVDSEHCIAFATKFVEDPSHPEDPIYPLCEDFFTAEEKDPLPLIRGIIKVLYQVGMVGVKPEPHLGRQWSFTDGAAYLTDSQLKGSASVYIHKTFWAALGVSAARRR